MYTGKKDLLPILSHSVKKRNDITNGDLKNNFHD